jgi:hypothetical protein
MTGPSRNPGQRSAVTGPAAGDDQHTTPPATVIRLSAAETLAQFASLLTAGLAPWPATAASRAGRGAAPPRPRQGALPRPPQQEQP